MTESTGAIHARIRASRLTALLAEADKYLTRYREEASRLGFRRLPLSDLATYDELRGLYVDKRLVGNARSAMAELITHGEQPTLGGDDRHFAEAVYGGHADDVHDALERLGLLKEE